MKLLRVVPLFVVALACTHVSDLGEHPGAPVDPCPSRPPVGDTPCPAGAAGCLYTSTCGARDVASCVDGLWIYWSGACTTKPPACPAESPAPIGEPCPTSDPLTCTFRNACNAYFTATCDGTTPWTGKIPACAGPCPETPPKTGEPCGADTVCSWKNACETLDHGKCSAGTWHVETTCASSECGAFLPKNGSPCSKLGLRCEYDDACAGKGTQKATCNDFIWFVDLTCT